MGDRFYGQREGKLGYSKTPGYVSTKAGTNKRSKKRLKKDILSDIWHLLGTDAIVSMDKMTIVGLETLEQAIKELK